MYRSHFVYLFICLGCFHLLLLWILLLWAFIYKLLFEYLFSILLRIYLGVELLGGTVVLCLTFWRTTNCFCSSCTILHSHQHTYKISNFPTFLPTLFFLITVDLTNTFNFQIFFLIMANLGCNFAVLVCISLMTNLNNFLIYWACSNPLTWFFNCISQQHTS